MGKPAIIIESTVGRHNANPGTRDRLIKGSSYKDLSTVCVVPTRGVIPARVVQSWMGLMAPMNNRFTRVFVEGMEVGEAYNHAVEAVLAHPEMSRWRFILTLEEDNMPPPDGLIRLCESIEGGLDGRKYDVMAGLYYTKGEGGQPMIYGNPRELPVSFRPQVPVQDAVQECRGTGMGFTLFRTEIFRDGRVPKPWFRTVQEYTPGQGTRAYTQDLFFFEELQKLGYRVASDNRVKVGHFDAASGIVW